MMFAEVNGVRLQYHVEGTGLPCIVPSLVGVPLYQRTLSAALRQHLQLIFVDLRGSGPSDSGPIDTVTLETLIDDLDGVRRALHLDRVAVLGHSVHGWLALAYARRYAKYVAGAIVIGTPPKAEIVGAGTYWETMASAERKALLARNLARLTEEDLGALPPHAAFIRRYLALGPKRFFDPAFDWSFFWDGCVFQMDLFARLYGLLGTGYDPTASFPYIACPVLIAVGIFDYPLPPLLWHGEMDRFPDVTYCVFERSGHWPHHEEQALFDTRVIQWLHRVKQPNMD